MYFKNMLFKIVQVFCTQRGKFFTQIATNTTTYITSYLNVVNYFMVFVDGIQFGASFPKKTLWTNR